MGAPERAVYDRIGAGYDATRRADPRLVDDLARLLSGGPPGPGLDIACGTGNYTGPLAARFGEVVGVDLSEVMLAAARAKSAGAAWVRARAEALPFGDAAFARASCQLAIHHVADLDAVMRETRRVLAPDARFVIFTSFPEQTRAMWLSRYWPAAIERSAERMPSRARLVEALTSAGFEAVRVEAWLMPEDFEDLFLYAGKHRPALYLDPDMRSGISTFSAVAEPDELAAGLARLEDDIATGAIAEIIARADDAAGDYAWVSAVRAAREF